MNGQILSLKRSDLDFLMESHHSQLLLLALVAIEARIVAEYQNHVQVKVLKLQAYR